MRTKQSRRRKSVYNEQVVTEEKSETTTMRSTRMRTSQPSQPPRQAEQQRVLEIDTDISTATFSFFPSFVVTKPKKRNLH